MEQLFSNVIALEVEKATAPHSSTLAWKIPWMKEPGRLQSMGSLRVRLSKFPFPFHFHALEKEMATHSSVLAWRIPVRGSLVGCHLWGRTESDTTEATQQQQQLWEEREIKKKKKKWPLKVHQAQEMKMLTHNLFHRDYSVYSIEMLLTFRCYSEKNNPSAI